MRLNRLLFLMVLIAAFACAGCDCPDPVECEACEECETMIEPTPGPIIIGTPTGTAIDWEVDGDTATVGPSILDPSTSDYCTLRGDMIGQAIHTFKFHIKDGGTINKATSVRMSNDDLIINVSESPVGTFIWTIKSKATTPPTVLCSNLIPGSFSGTEIPLELTQMTELYETDAEQTGERLDIRAKMP